VIASTATARRKPIGACCMAGHFWRSRWACASAHIVPSRTERIPALGLCGGDAKQNKHSGKNVPHWNPPSVQLEKLTAKHYPVGALSAKRGLVVSDNHQIAEEKAARYAPYPKHSPVTVGALTMFGSGIVLALFMGLSGISSERLVWQQVVVLGVSFALPYWYVWAQQQKYFKAVAAEFLKLEEARNAPRS
jgi:hypothetical protein